MSRIQNHDNDDDASSSSSKKTFKTFDDDGVVLVPWSDVNHHILFLVMMKLGVIDFLAFSGVCMSWRSFALTNKNMFMASKPPMSICMDHSDNRKDCWYLEDFEGKRFRTIIPNSDGKACFGLTCGYLILGGKESQDFWLVNPITRHELHFPHFPLKVRADKVSIRAILVFSPSISRWVFVVLHRNISRPRAGKPKILFYITGKRGWNHVSCTLSYPSFVDLHAFKGKIYTLHCDFSVRELRINPNRKRKWTLLETKNFPKPDLSHHPEELVNSNKNLYVIYRLYRFSEQTKVLELDFGEMKWVSPETIGDHAFFLSNIHMKSCAAIKPESWAGLHTQYKSYDYFRGTDEIQQEMFYYKSMWYFPHDCLNVNLLDE